MARILLIDDDHAFRKMLRMALEKVGYEVVDAADADEGLKLYAQTNYDLIIIDVFMPKIDGIKAIHMIMEDFNSPKIIAMTGACLYHRTNEDVLIHAKACVAVEVFNKASAITDLLTKIKAVLCE